RMSWMPADSTTARTEPPAMTPVPFDAGRRRTFAAPKSAVTGSGIVRSTSGTSMRGFLASSPPFLIASGTSSAFPSPPPTAAGPGCAGRGRAPFTKARRRGECAAGAVVDHLGVDLAQRAVDGEARPVRGPRDAGPQAAMPFLPCLVPFGECHPLLPLGLRADLAGLARL